MNPKILFITYYFPPMGGIGSQRAFRFFKYLSRKKYDPYVITPNIGCYYTDNSISLEGFRKQIIYTQNYEINNILNKFRRKNNVNVSFNEQKTNYSNEKTHKLISLFKNFVHNWIYIPDGCNGWIIPALSNSYKLCKKQFFDVIFSSSPPVSAHFIAGKISKKFNIPWIVDFRDLWVLNHFNIYSSRFRKKVDRKLESWIIKNADAVITATPYQKQQLIDCYEDFFYRKFYYIPNSYDPEEYEYKNQNYSKKLLISFTGTLYGIEHTPISFFKAIKELLDSKFINYNDIKIYFAGLHHYEAEKCAEKYIPDNIISFLGVISHNEALKLQLRSHILLLLIPDNNRQKVTYTGKIFEYFGSKKPILALVPIQGGAAELINDTKTGWVVNQDDIGKIKDIIMKCYNELKEKGKLDFRPICKNIEKYESKETTKTLIEIINRISNGNNK
jgi:glycosyltransferase involved in cell wall biosynthesis